MHIRMLSVLTGLLLFVQPLAAHAQTVDGFLLTQMNSGAGTGGSDQLQVTVALAGSESFDLGTSTLMFTYNSDALTIPSGATVNQQLVEGTDCQFVDPFLGDPGNGKFYGSSTVTVFGAQNRLSINVVLDVANFGQPVLTSPTPVVTLFFDITDPNQTANLAWVTSGDANPTVVQLGDNQTAVTQDTFSDDNAPLPVELTAFEAQVDDGAVQLRWETASETNNAGFEIQRMRVQGEETGGRKNDAIGSDGQAMLSWETIAFVDGHGTTTEPQRYTYQVPDLPTGTHRFRLRQVDFDGAFDYSPTVEVTVEAPHVLRLEPNYPNPFNPSTEIRFTVPSGGRAELVVYDVLGQQVATLFSGPAQAGRRYRAVFEAGELASGLYLSVLRYRGQQRTRRMLLLK